MGSPTHIPKVLLLAAFVVTSCSDEQKGVSGVVEVERYVIDTQIGGTIETIDIAEGDTVDADAVVATVDCVAPRLELEAANADLRQARSNLEMLEDGSTPEEIDAAKAQALIAREELSMGRRGASRPELEQLDAAIGAVEAKRKLAVQSVQRTEELTRGGVGTPAQLDQARAELDSLEAEKKRLVAQREQARQGARVEQRSILKGRLAQARAQLKRLEKGPRTQELAMARARVDAARARHDLAQNQVDHCEIRTPIAGRVDVVNFRVGELLAPGAAVASVIDPKSFEFRTFARQTQLGDLQPGDAVKVRIDGYADTPLKAKVTRIFDTPEFTASNVQTSDDRMLLVYRVELDVEPRDEVPLRPGMTGVVRLSDTARDER